MGMFNSEHIGVQATDCTLLLSSDPIIWSRVEIMRARIGEMMVKTLPSIGIRIRALRVCGLLLWLRA